MTLGLLRRSRKLGVVESEHGRTLAGGAFILGALVPVLPFLASLPDERIWALGMAASTLHPSVITVGVIAGVIIGQAPHAG